MEHILPLGPDEDPADLRKPGLFDEQSSSLRRFVEGNHTLETVRTWFQGMISSVRRRS